MKSLKYLAIALAVAGVAVTATPADAGSVGVNGGKTQKVTRVDNVYRDETHKNVDNYKTENVTKRVDKTAAGTTTNKTVDGGTVEGKSKYRASVYAQNTLDVTNQSTGYKVHQGYTGVYDSRDGAKNAAHDICVAAVKKTCCAATSWIGRTGVEDTGNAYYTDSSDRYGNKHIVRANAGTLGWVHNYNLSGTGDKTAYGNKYEKSSKTTTTTSTRTEKTGSNTVTTKRDVNTKNTEAKTGETWAFKGQTYTFSDDAIIVGDTDGGNVYAAQGSMTIENHYDRTDHYLLTHYWDHITTNTTTDTYTTYTDTLNTKTVTYAQDYLYTIKMGVAISPIILDLDGDGKIEASNGKYLPHAFVKDCAHYAMFDFHGNGFPMLMEWVGANDGLLCRPEADGTVKGTNLFGTANGYDNGYDELASLDTNKDGQISGEELEGLMVWQDANSNGIADKGELKSLESLGITSISANHKNYSSTFTRNGKNYKTFDWWPNGKVANKVDVAR